MKRRSPLPSIASPASIASIVSSPSSASTGGGEQSAAGTSSASASASGLGLGSSGSTFEGGVVIDGVAMGTASPQLGESLHHSDRGSMQARAAALASSKKAFISLLADWICVVLLAGISIGIEKGSPFQRYITEGEVWMYSYPLKGNTYPSWAILPGCFLLPLVAITGCHFARRACSRKSQPVAVGGWSSLHSALLGLSMSIAFTLFVTTTVKLMVGRPRPDFIARCFGGEIPPEIPWRVPGYPACTGDEAKITEGRKSFPSGHSSIAFAGLLYLTLYLADFLGVFSDGKTPANAGDGKASPRHPWALFVSLAPSLGAAYIAASRTSDYWHHCTDVLAGAILGSTVAYLAYAQQRNLANRAALESQYRPVGSDLES